MFSFTDKLFLCVGSSLLFLILNLEGIYLSTQTFTGFKIYDVKTKCYTLLGLFIHIILFGLITYLVMLGSNVDEELKQKHFIYSTILFCLISTRSLQNILTIFFGPNLSNLQGCPNVYGLITASIIYLSILMITLTITY